ncbi:MAG: hypothetical protein ACHQ49_08905 [Elusimicrobiota bacterium]
MNSIKKITVVAFVSAVSTLALSPVARAANTGLNPSSVQIKTIQVMISTSADCSSPVNAGLNATPAYQEMTAGPTLFSGAVPAGTYKCVMMNFSSLIKFTPSANSDDGGCVSTTQYVRDVCTSGSSFVTPAGATVQCAGSGNSFSTTENDVWAYFSTTGSTAHLGGLSPATAFLLSTPLVVTGSKAITFVTDFDGQLQSTMDGGVLTCDCEPPVMSFR